jgi:hypothetical protein
MRLIQEHRFLLPPIPHLFLSLKVKERDLEVIAPKNNIKCGNSEKEKFSGHFR